MRMVRKGASARRSFKHGSRTSGRVSLLDPAAPEPPPLNTDPSDPDDRVYLHAAAIFQNTHLERPAAQRLVSFGKRSEVSVPEVRGEASQRLAFQLAFNTLKYQELLEDVLIDSGFCASQPMPDGGMSLVAVLLTDLLDRKFLPRLQPANQEQEEEAVREVEACLLRFRTKLVASLARCRIKHDLLTLENILPEKIRHRQERARELPLYAWINTLRSSFEKVREVLRKSGFSCVKSVAQLEGRSFCTDTHCQDLLVFPNGMKRELTNTGLLTDCRLVLQDKSCCVGPWALRPLLAEGGDVLMAGCFSARTVAHVSAVSAHTHTDTHTDTHISRVQSKVIVCVGDEPQAQKDELQNTLAKMGCKNVKLLPVSLECVDVCDVRLQEVRVALVMPACSLSAVSNPVDYIMQENRDPRLMLDLSHGSVSPEKLQTLVCRQRKDLQRVGQFPQVRAVLYSTCSVHSEENEEVLKTILSQSQEHQSTAPPYRLSSPGLPQDSITEDEDDSLEMKASFFRLEASDHHNGCFVALLTRQPEPEVKETPQQVLARAAAKGLLDGLQLNQPISRERRGRRSRRTSANHKRSTKTRPHTTQSDQSRVTEFLNYEMRGSNPEPTVSPRSSSLNDQPASSRRLFQGVFSRTGHTPNNTSHTPNTAGHTSNKTGPSFKTTSSTSSTTDHTLYTTGSTSNTTSSTSSTTDHTLYTTGSTSNTTGSTSSTTGHTPYTTGSTSSTTDHTPYTTGSTFKTTGTTSHITGPVHNTTGSTPNLSSFSEFYCTGLTGLSSASASVIVVHSSTPAAPPKGRHEVLRPTTVMFPPVLSSSGGLLPQRRSYVLTSPTHTIKSPAHTHQHWSNSTPAPPRTQAAFRVRLNHLRPWL